MAKKQSFLDKAQKKKFATFCPVCSGEVQPIKHIKAEKGPNGAWKFRTQNVGVCKCNEKEIYV